MTILFNDFETRSRIDITKCGGGRYARDASTRALMLAYAFDDGPVKQWVPAEGQKMPAELKEAMLDPHVEKSAWNAAFELAIWEHVLGFEVDPHEWRCTMVRAQTLSMPGQLAKAGPIVNLSDDKKKDSRGKALIRRFCVPRKPTKKKPWKWADRFTDPDEWEEFKEYNRQDIVAERSIYRRIKGWNLPDHEWDLWALDQEINNDGIPVNPEVVRRAIEFTEYLREKRVKRIEEITGGANPRSGPQMLEWLRANGYVFHDLKAGHVKKASRDMTLREDVREVLSLRAEIARTSTDKYYAMARSMDPDTHVIRGCLQFAGAQRTWRWSGRLIQPQNLARPHPSFEETQPKLVDHIERFDNETLEKLYDKRWDQDCSGAIDMLASAIRPTIQAPKGELVFSADLNAIENRVLGYLAQDQKILNVFRLSRDPYIDFAGYMFDTDYDTEWELFKPADGSKGSKDHRTIAKPGVLGCGYMLSAGEQWENEDTGEIEASGLLGYAWNMGVRQFTEEDAKLSVKVWRDTFKDAVEFWWEIDKAAKKCMRTEKPAWAGPVRFDLNGPFMRMLLPSGRFLHYVRPRMEQVELVWCDEKNRYMPEFMARKPNYEVERKIKESITYEGLNDRKQWGRIGTHPGKWTENADQAISRDLLAEAMRRFARRVPRNEGRIRLHVHDEIIGTGPEKFAERNLKILTECMTEPMPWASEKELPLGAAGGISRVWIKD